MKKEKMMENLIQVRIKKVRKNIRQNINQSNKLEGTGTLPYYATPGAAGADLYACLENDCILKAGERIGIPTGIAIELPGPHLVALIFARSGLASRQGLSLSNGVGVVDADYRGEIIVLMVNHGQEEVTIHHGDRIAQMLLMPSYQAVFEEVEELEDTERGARGFGSTGQG